MEPTTAPIPILRIQQLPAHQTGGQPQQSPFTQGQLLQGLISAKNDNNQFTLDINGRQIQAESTTNLQVGQKLDLQVAALTPRVELRILGHPTQRLIGNSIHLFGQQGSILSDLANIAEKSVLLPQLSNEAKGTLQLYASGLHVGQNTDLSSLTQFRVVLGQLAGATLNTLLSQENGTEITFRETISNLLQQLTQIPSLPASTAARIAQLVTDYSNRTTAQPGVGNLPQTMSMETSALLSPQSLMLLNDLVNRQENPLATNLIVNPSPGIQVEQGRAVSPALHALVTLLTDLEAEQTSIRPHSPHPVADGGQVRELIDRLGLSLERSLAEGRLQEAVQTLKYALMELSQQLPAEDKASTQADQLTKSIELYQLLQIRLAGESLLFLPLPFSFLNQGYLVVDQNQQRNNKEDAGTSSAPTYELHLQLEGLGNLQITVRQQGERLALTFYTQDAERAGFLAQYREEINHWLPSADVESVRFLVGAKEPATSLLAKIVHGISGMVDTKA